MPILPAGQVVHSPIFDSVPGGQGTHAVCAALGCVPPGHVVQTTPSGLISLLPQRMQNVECPRKEQASPGSHGFWLQRVTSAASPEKALSGWSKLVLLIMMLRAEMDMSALPRAATLCRKMQPSMTSLPWAAVAMAPPCHRQTSLAWKTEAKAAHCAKFSMIV
jgi:hypothetical protein